MWLQIVIGVLLLLSALFGFDWYFHLNIIGLLLLGRCQKQSRLTDTVSSYRLSSVYNTDLTFDHLNNAKYVLYMDFAKAHFWARTRILGYLVKIRAFPLQSATIVRYMRPIPIFTVVRVDTKVRK